LTIPQLHFAIAELTRPSPEPPRVVVERIRAQIARNEHVRQARWRAKGLIAPKRRVA